MQDYFEPRNGPVSLHTQSHQLPGQYLSQDSENLNTCPLVQKRVDFLVDKLIFQQLAQMGTREIVTLHYAKN